MPGNWFSSEAASKQTIVPYKQIMVAIPITINNIRTMITPPNFLVFLKAHIKITVNSQL
jgi:hypothetical protein